MFNVLGGEIKSVLIRVICGCFSQLKTKNSKLFSVYSWFLFFFSED